MATVTPADGSGCVMDLPARVMDLPGGTTDLKPGGMTLTDGGPVSHAKFKETCKGHP
jgi:hypothetical protein